MLQIYDSAVSEAQFLHGREAGNSRPTSDALFFSILRKMPEPQRSLQKSYRMSMLDEVAAGVIGASDTYISQSSFWSSNRRAVSFKQTRAAWVDLDLYNIDKVVDGATISEILRHAETMGIPAPTSVIASGRGCYLKWIFRTPITQRELPTWQTLQAVLTSAYSTLAADMKARDASRVLRLLQTRNSKGGGLVELIDGCGEIYDFNEMCRSVESLRLEMLLETESKVMVSGARKIAKRTTALSEQMLHASQRGDMDALNLFTEMRRPVMLEKLSARSLNWNRFCDLRSLYEQRGGIPVGERDITMFWMLNFLSASSVIHASNWNCEIEELQRAFPAPESFEPLTDGSMSSLLRRVRDKERGCKYTWNGADVTPLYRPSNRHLIEAFSITPEEMKPLTVIVSGDEKRARQDAKADGRADRREARQQWRHEVRQAFDGHLAACQASASDPLVSDPSTSAHVELKALSLYLGVERTRVNRFWNNLKREHAVSICSDVVALSAVSTHFVDVAQPESSQQVASDVISQPAINPFESVRLAKLATFKAIEAKQAQAALVFERRKLSLENAWALRKLSGLVKPESLENIEDTEMAITSNALTKKMALLQAARETEMGLPIESSSSVAAAEVLLARDSVVSTPNPQPEAASATSHDDGSEGYSDFFEAPQDCEWIPANFSSAAPLALASVERADSAQSSMAPEPAPGSMTAAVSAPSITAPKVPMTMAERLKARSSASSLRPTRPAPQPAAARAPVAAAPPQVAIKTAALAEPVLVNPLAANGDQFSHPLSLPSSEFVAPLSATERLRQASERMAKLPPMQRESKGSTERRPLVERGAGAPVAYPSEDVWPSNTIPPGSNYTEAEWKAARHGDGNQCFEVIEIQSAQKSMLIQLVVPELVSTRKVVNGVMVTQAHEAVSDAVEQAGINSLLRQIYSDCLLVSSDSYPTFFGATEADFTLNSARYRVIRPRADYIDPGRSYRVGAKLTCAMPAAPSKVEIVRKEPLLEKISLQDCNNSDDSEKENNFFPMP